MALFLRCGLIPHWGKWYSSNWYFHLQTTRLLEGRLAIEPMPENLYHDFSWAHGVQQHWGLGVPMLRLPFEWLALRLGYRGFPDRLVLLGFLFLTSLVFFHALFESHRLAQIEPQSQLAGASTRSTRTDRFEWRSCAWAACFGVWIPAVSVS